MDIRSALDQIVTIQGGLSIASPEALSIKKAWKYMAPQDATVPETPCWMNTWRLINEVRAISMRQQFYTVHMQLFVDNADQERAADIATAFHVALVSALDGNITLTGSAKNTSLRGGDPTLVILERGGLSFVGLDEYLDLELWDAATFG